MQRVKHALHSALPWVPGERRNTLQGKAHRERHTSTLTYSHCAEHTENSTGLDNVHTKTHAGRLLTIHRQNA